MQDLNDKITGGTLLAAEWNEVPTELQNIIEDMGIVLSSGDLDQLGKAIVSYVAAGTFYAETGSGDAFIATVIGAKQGLVSTSPITDGAIVRFRSARANTGASTLNVNGLGVESLTREDGSALSAGDIATTRDTECVWDEGSNNWRILNSALITGEILSLSRPQEVLSGQLFRNSASVIQLRPLIGVDVIVGIDNEVLTNSGLVTFDMATDLEGAEGASVALYLYLRDLAGVLDPQISSTAPDLAGGTKPGYKAGDGTRRCVGSTWNDAGQDLIESVWLPGGEVLFKSRDADHEHSLATTQNLWSSAIGVNVPHTASAFHVLWKIGVASVSRSAAIGASDAATNPSSTDTILGSNANEILLEMSEDGSGAGRQTLAGVIPVASETAPGFKFTTYNQSLTQNELVVTGYNCRYAPK